ncbi:hypothetical protein ACFLS8_01425 [Chloroflexota bacterium]
MDTETIIIIVILVLMVLLPIVVLGILHKGGISISFCRSDPSSASTKAKVLQEIIRIVGPIKMIKFNHNSGLSHGEFNMLMHKANPFYARGFPIRGDAKSRDLYEWINNPGINRLIPDGLLLSMAAHTPVPVKTMEKLLKNLLQSNYDMYYRNARKQLVDTGQIEAE